MQKAASVLKPSTAARVTSVGGCLFSTSTRILKADTALGIVFGFAIVCKVDGEEYFDLQGDNIPEDAMAKAAAEFMADLRVGKAMHDGDQVADVVFAFPLTTDIAKALDIETKQTGLLIGFKPRDAAMLEKFANGEYTGFSIGGERVIDEPAEVAA
jgi:hypothetical protein